MTNEHNPIAQLVTKIQQRWAEEITPQTNLKLVRWLIDANEAKLFESFLQLESSPQGILSEFFVTLLVPFKSVSTYSGDLIDAFFDGFDKGKELLDQLAAEGKPINWDSTFYKQKALSKNVNADQLLFEILSTFHKALNLSDRKITVALFQHSITSTAAYNDWLKNIYKIGIPEHIQFCVFDLKDDRFYDKLFSGIDPSHALTVISDLDLAGAIKKVVQSGDPNQPATRLHQYIQQMSEAVAEKNLNKLDNKGDACIKDMTKSKVKSLMATAHIVYAGMLFNFKKYDQIENVLANGLQIAESGKKAGDATCQALITQFYSFRASNYQLNKKNKEAIKWFCISAEASIEVNQSLPAISAYRQAANLAKKYDSQNYPRILELGYDAGRDLTKEQTSFSDYSFLGFDYYNYLNQNQHFEISTEVDHNMKELFGIMWKEDVKKSLQGIEKRQT